MATKLERPVHREVTVKDALGREGPVIVTVHTWGVTLRGKGTSRRLNVTWQEMARGILFENAAHVPARFTQNKLGWLVERAASNER